MWIRVNEKKSENLMQNCTKQSLCINNKKRYRNEQKLLFDAIVIRWYSIEMCVLLLFEMWISKQSETI